MLNAVWDADWVAAVSRTEQKRHHDNDSQVSARYFTTSCFSLQWQLSHIFESWLHENHQLCWHRSATCVYVWFAVVITERSLACLSFSALKHSHCCVLCSSEIQRIDSVCRSVFCASVLGGFWLCHCVQCVAVYSVSQILSCCCTLLLHAGRGAEYCDQFSVCLSVREHISGTAGSIFTKFCVYIPCGRGLVLLWRHCDILCTSGFMDDITFGRNGSGAEMWRRYRAAAAMSSVVIPGQILMSVNVCCWCVLLVHTADTYRPVIVKV